MHKDHLEIHIDAEPDRHLLLMVYGTSDKAKLFDQDDALQNGEARFQLVEGCEYEYEILDLQQKRKYQFAPVPEILRFSKRHENAGIIRTGVYVGTLTLSLVDLSTNEIIKDAIDLEIQSVKADYRTDYHNMLADITEYYTELVMAQGSPVKQKFEVDANSSSLTLYQRFAFVQSIISSEDFTAAIHRIIACPVKKWADDEILKKTISLRHIDKSCVRQFATSKHRVVPPSAVRTRLKMGLKSVPESVHMRYKKETTDIQENQFVKYVLTSFCSFCENLAQSKNASKRLQIEAEGVSEHLRMMLDCSFFKQISTLSHFNFNSPILQRKEGYRQILQTWLMFDLAAKLSWTGSEDVYKAGKRNVAALYEYWVFFKMLRIVSETFNINPESKTTLISSDDDKIDLDLKQGKVTALRGSCEISTRRLNVCLYYNRTFVHRSEINVAGSWTTNMRPDYTLSIWTGDDSSIHGEEKAEKEDSIIHIHFDAKYRVADIPLIENLDETSLAEEKEENVLHIYKRGDLMKMHTYKDAIRRTSGAYIIYPGNAEPKKIRGFHEIIPGLGAFCLSPSSADEDEKLIKSFLLDVREHLLNRASERERIAYYAHDTYDTDSEYSCRVLKETLPEMNGNRKLLPNETYVLIGYYRDSRHLEWIQQNKKYNFRAGYNRNGTLNIEKEIVAAQYLLLHHGNDDSMLYKMSVKGPVVASREELIKRGYPQITKADGSVDTEKENKNIGSIYLVFSLEEAEHEFKGCSWKLTRIKEHQGHQSAHPYCISLTDLMLLQEK